MTEESALTLIECVQEPGDIFGDYDGMYKSLLRVVHSDLFSPDRRKRASEAAGKLAAF